MSLVTFQHSGAITVDVPITATWNLPLVGQPGTATLRLPHDSAALDSTYIDPDCNSWVRVTGNSDFDEWHGYITELDEGPEGVVVHATEWWGLLMRVPVPVSRAFVHVTPGVIVTAAMSASPWEVLSAVEGGPDIPRWTFGGESVWDHVKRMMDLSNQELSLGSGQTFRWGTQTGTRYEPVLLAPHDLQEARQGTTSHEVAGKVTVISGSTWYTAVDAVDGWPAHAVVKESLAPAAMAARAENELMRRAQPVRTVSGTLARAHRGIGLGDSFGVFLPYAGLGEGRLRRCRVVSRSYEEARDAVSGTFQVLTDTPVTGAPLLAAAGGSRFMQRLKERERVALRGHRYLAETTV